MSVHCQLDLRILVVVHTVKVAQKHVTKNKELRVADHIRRLYDSEYAAATELGIQISSVHQVGLRLHLEHGVANLVDDRIDVR